MRPTMPGLTRSAGERIVRWTLSAGHEVTALARRPDALGSADPWPRVLAGDVPDPASLGDGVVKYDIEPGVPGISTREPYVV